VNLAKLSRPIVGNVSSTFSDMVKNGTIPFYNNWWEPWIFWDHMSRWQVVNKDIVDDFWSWIKFGIEWVIFYLAYITENPVRRNDPNLVIECYNALGYDWVNQYFII
jgi:hypothetical protein